MKIYAVSTFECFRTASVWATFLPI